MRHLTILVPDGENNLSSIVGAYKIFSRANEYWKKAGKRELFKIELADFYFVLASHHDLAQGLIYNVTEKKKQLA